MNDLLDVSIENYEGPLDLLIHLIHKNEMNIFEVRISEITNHFVSAIREMQQMDMDIAAEFIHMASYLIYLKSRSLLPKDDTSVLDDYIEDEFQLAQILVDLAYCKDLSIKLTTKAKTAAMYLQRSQSVIIPREQAAGEDATTLISTYFDVITEKVEKKVVIESTQEQVDDISKRVEKDILSHKETMWSKLVLNLHSRFEKSIAFLKILTLGKDKQIEASQEVNFGDILIRRIK